MFKQSKNTEENGIKENRVTLFTYILFDFSSPKLKARVSYFECLSARLSVNFSHSHWKLGTNHISVRGFKIKDHAHCQWQIIAKIAKIH